MPKNVKMKGRAIPIGGRKSVHVFLEEDGGGYIHFQSPITKVDINDGKAIPRAKAERYKCQLITQISLSKEALYALRDLLNEMLI